MQILYTHNTPITRVRIIRDRKRIQCTARKTSKSRCTRYKTFSGTPTHFLLLRINRLFFGSNSNEWRTRSLIYIPFSTCGEHCLFGIHVDRIPAFHGSVTAVIVVARRRARIRQTAGISAVKSDGVCTDIISTRMLLY